MLGKVLAIDENVITCNLAIPNEQVIDIINLYVLIESLENKIIGEVINVKDKVCYINILGEVINNKFVFGVAKKPSFNANVYLLSKENIPLIIGIDNYDEKRDLILGVSAIYPTVNIGVNINQFFSNHFAIFGTTGSGKSCSVARMFQNLFGRNGVVPYNSSILIFDAYGEYHKAFCDLNKINPNVNFKAYTTNTKEENILRIPLWLLTVDDIALLLGATSVNQLPIIEKALKLVTVFANKDSNKHKNDIIARALLDILSSGNQPSQIRDQIISVLASYNTPELNIDTPVYTPGYTRPLKQCLFIDQNGKIREMELVMNFLQGFLDDSLFLTLPDGSFAYTLEDLKNALDFALISEGILSSDRVYDEMNVLKVRLHTLLNSSYKYYFTYDKYVSRGEYIKEVLYLGDKKAQIINFNINYIDDRLAKSITKIYSKLFFDYVKNMDERASLPIHIVLEEAHRYVQNDNDSEVLGYNIFERITKEGRKYGIVLGLISQRPSELSTTCISQASNFLVFKMLHPVDVDYIKAFVPNVTNEIIKKLGILQPGSCIAFGNAFKVPALVKFAMPYPSPASNSCDVSNVWFVN